MKYSYDAQDITSKEHKGWIFRVCETFFLRVHMCLIVCVCVREREKEIVCMCVRESESVCVRECVFV